LECFIHDLIVASWGLGSGHGDFTLRYRIGSSPVRQSTPNEEHTQLGLTDYFLGDDQLPPVDANCLSLLVQSGDADKDHGGYKFSKIVNREDLFMPLWSLGEMRALNRALPPAAAAAAPLFPAAAPVTSLLMLADRDLELRFYQWGGCVRSVFITSEDWSTTNIQSLLDQVSSIESLQSAVGKIRSNPKALGRLIHLDADPETFQVIFCFFSFLLHLRNTLP
jgi:hypothetical protein